MDEKVQRLLKGRFLTEAYFLDPGVFVSINLTIVSRSTLSRQSQTKSALERLAACGRWQRQGRRPWRWSLITKEFSHPQDVPIDSAQGRLQPSAGKKIYCYEGWVARDRPFGPTSTFPLLYSKAHSMAHRAKQPWRRISPTAAGRIQCPFSVPHKKELTVSQAVSPLNALFVWFLFDEAFHVGAGVCVVSLWFCVRPTIANARRMAATYY